MAKRKPTPGERLRQQQVLFGPVANDPKPETDRMLVPDGEADRPQIDRKGIWTPEITAQAVRMWTVEKASLSMIAEALSAVVGKPVGRNSVIGKMARLGLSGKGGRQAAQGGWAAKPERAESEALTKPMLISAATFEAARDALCAPTGNDMSALFGVTLTERPSHPAGQWPITDLRMGQCRYIAGSDHLCCGEPAPIGPENPHGSWCAAHRAMVFSTESRLADRQFLKAAARVR